MLTGQNTYSGGTTIDSGTLQIGNGGTSGSIVGDVTDVGTLAFDRSDSITFGGVISGSGGLVQRGSGTLVLTGSDIYSGQYDHQRWNAATGERFIEREHRRERHR